MTEETEPTATEPVRLRVNHVITYETLVTPDDGQTPDDVRASVQAEYDAGYVTPGDDANDLAATVDTLVQIVVPKPEEPADA